MRIEFLWKDSGSNVGNCASLSRTTEPDGYIINGTPVDAETYAQIPETGPGETGVWVPANVIDRIRREA